jgi:hypothetical protein
VSRFADRIPADTIGSRQFQRSQSNERFTVVTLKGRKRIDGAAHDFPQGLEMGMRNGDGDSVPIAPANCDSSNQANAAAVTLFPVPTFVLSGAPRQHGLARIELA